MTDSDRIRQNHQLKYEAPLPSPLLGGIADMLQIYPHPPLFSSLRTADTMTGNTSAVSSSHFKTTVKVTPQLVFAKRT